VVHASPQFQLRRKLCRNLNRLPPRRVEFAIRFEYFLISLDLPQDAP
jgi:hypothetical protein